MYNSDNFVIDEIKKLDNFGVVALLDILNCHEFKDFIVQKKLDGYMLLELTKTKLKLWDHKCNADKLISLIEDLEKTPDKYLKEIEKAKQFQLLNTSKHNQYQTVTSNRRVEGNKNSIDELMMSIKPEISFLYRNKQRNNVTSYTPMNSNNKKTKKFYRFSSFEYPIFNIKYRPKIDDRGYYDVKVNKSEPKYKSMNNIEIQNEISDDHLYEDLSSNDETAANNNVQNLSNKSNLALENSKLNVKKIQGLFQSFRLSFLKKIDEIKGEPIKDQSIVQTNKSVNKDTEMSGKDSAHLYENNDSSDAVYDDVHRRPGAQNEACLEQFQKVPLEDYLVPICKEPQYCSVAYKQESVLGFILSLFESFGKRRESSDTISEDYQPEKFEDPEPRKWNDERKLRGGNMADRPLPVPVENEPYYMLVDRFEAKNMLMGQPDGTFILRPSSQPNHIYTLSVSCRNEVHNVGIRRRPDGRLALGYARRGERTFDSITALLKHHKKQRLLLVASGGILGATTLIGSPVYYQTPSGLPVHE